MKQIATIFCSAALTASALTLPAQAADRMTLRLGAEQTAVNTDDLASGDKLIKGGLYFDNYSGIAKLRMILRSDEPILIENGGFTLDPNGALDSDGNVRHALFESHSEAMYTPKSLVDNDTNIIVWYGGHTDGVDPYYQNGVIRNAGSSFASFDYRIPKDIKPGEYTCYISEKVETTAGGMIMEDLTVCDETHQLEPHKEFDLQPVTFTVYKRGDINCDGKISTEDAQSALVCYVEQNLAKKTLTDKEFSEIAKTKLVSSARLAADASGNGVLDVEDAQGILQYYVSSLAGKQPDWNKIF